MATVERANQILILEQSRVIEYGQREKLIKNPRLWRTSTNTSE
ncbi:hypothetical protein [Anabaena sp. UHCC 0399]|nr:hypothetical protein [Anabaena sp. UHCC 0399]MEA5569421.1 hypothetical protein [Anabaena sp. UHCC 0399]